MQLASSFTLLPPRFYAPCRTWACPNLAIWRIEHTGQMVCKWCLYSALEDLNRNPLVSAPELAPLVLAYVRDLLHFHFAECPVCSPSPEVPTVLDCLLEDEGLAPFVVIEGEGCTIAALSEVITAFLTAEILQ